MYTSGHKQQVGQKKIKKCANIIGKPVISACMNGGDLPHHTAIAWTGSNSAYIVNLKKETALEYVRNGKFILKRVTLPFKVFIVPMTVEQKLAKQKLNDFKIDEKVDNDWEKLKKLQGNDYIEDVKRDTQEAIERMKKRFQPKVMPPAGEETLYQRFIRSAEELKEEVKQDIISNTYKDMT